MFNGWLKWQVDADAKFGQKAKEIVSSRWPVAEWVFDAVSLGIQTAATLQSGGVVESAGSRPIGFQRVQGTDTVEFSPKVLLLIFDTAEAAISQRPSGLGLGVFAVSYPEDPDLQGNYELYLQVERIGGIIPDVDLSHDKRLYREENRPEIYVIIGGAKFWIPDPATLQRLYGGFQDVIVVPNNGLSGVPTIPRDGTLIKQAHSDYVWLIQAGMRRYVS